VYAFIILLQTLILPVVSGGIQLLVSGGNPLLVFGLWWGFWGVGIRLTLAGLSQVMKPDRTRKILGVDAADANQVVQELGYANLGMGVTALAIPFLPTWGVLLAVPGAIFLLLAGVRHVFKPGKNAAEQVATWTDLLVFVGVTVGVIGLAIVGW
jgi:hypothetical protein